MYVTTDQLMKRDGRQPFKLFVNNHIMSPTKSYSQVLLDAFPNLTVPFGMSGGRCKRHHLEKWS